MQNSASLQAQALRVLADEIKQGQGGITVECDLLNGANSNTATAKWSSTSLQFLLNNTTDVSSSYSVVPYATNVSQLIGGSTTRLSYYISAANQATPGIVYVYQIINYTDENSGKSYALRGGVDSFTTREAAILQVTAITPSRSTVTQGQTAPWTVHVEVKNTSSSAVTLSFNAAKTYINFVRDKLTIAAALPSPSPQRL